MCIRDSDWLLLLGQRRDWARFAVVAPGLHMNDDRDVRCYALAMDLKVSGVGHPEEVKQQWYAQKDAGDGCRLAAAVHYAAGQLSEDDIWRKARLAAEANQANATRQAVAIAAPAAPVSLDEIWAKPVRFLTLQQQPPPDLHVASELTLLALIRLAQTDCDQAAELLAKQRHLSDAQRSWGWGAIGKQSAQNLSPDALRYFANAPPQSQSDEHLAWRVRAALRQGQWEEVLGVTQAMSAAVNAEPAWIYWRARALRQLARSEADVARAAQLFQSIQGTSGFYEVLATEELGRSITLPPAPPLLSALEQETARSHTGLRQALAAIRMGLRSEGVREWNYHTNLHQPGGMNDRELLAAANLACQHEVWDRCINTSERTKNVVDVAQRFVMPHQQAVLAHSAHIGLDAAYVYGLIRQESRFVTDARSGVGASGLMQIMPATARWTAKKMGLTHFDLRHIDDLKTNITIGTGYLQLVLDDFGGSMLMASAAYNAGPGRPRRWRGQTGGPVLEGAIWAENVPFAETRDYVKKVLFNTTLYAALITGLPQSLKQRLGQVGPRDASAPAVNRALP